MLFRSITWVFAVLAVWGVAWVFFYEKRRAILIMGAVLLLLAAYGLDRTFPMPQPAPSPSPLPRRITDVSFNDIPLLTDGHGGYALEFPCKNIGGFPARKAMCGGMFFFAPSVEGKVRPHVQEQYYEKYRQAMDRARDTGIIPPLVDIDPGQTLTGRSSIGRPQGKLKYDLQKGSQVILVLGTAVFADDSGEHKKEYCRWITPPFPPPGRIDWLVCDLHNGQIY